MSKENISATVDPDVGRYVGRDDVNTSGLVNKLLKQHMSGGTTEKQMLQFRMDQVKSEIEALQARLGQKQEELTELQAREGELEEEKEDVLNQAEEVLDWQDLKDKNNKVEFWADEAGLTVNDLVEELEGTVQ